MFDIDGNHKNLRRAFTESVPPMIPYIGLYGKLLLTLEETQSNVIKLADVTETIVNVYKVGI
jgi:hypothetical protein